MVESAIATKYITLARCRAARALAGHAISKKMLKWLHFGVLWSTFCNNSDSLKKIMTENANFRKTVLIIVCFFNDGVRIRNCFVKICYILEHFCYNF